MPRTTTLECPGCPPLRALTFDSLGLIKVIESRGVRATPQVVERWGDPDASKCVLAASIDDRKQNPLLAVARKNGAMEVLNPLNGEVRATISKDGDMPEDENVVSLHLFRRERSSRSCNVLTCTTKGNASLRSIEFDKCSSDDASASTPRTWKVCGSGNILCSKVDASENFAIFGGKGVEVNLWDLEKCSKFWTAKPPPRNSLDIFTPTWFTCTTFLSSDDHRKFAAGTNSHQVNLYDISAQRRPILSFDFRETPIKAVTEDQDGHTIYVGNGSGDLASFDIRTGTENIFDLFLLVKICSFVRKIVGMLFGEMFRKHQIHSQASTSPCVSIMWLVEVLGGLDSYLRLWDIETRQLLSATFLKQHLVEVVFDSNYADKVPDEQQVEVAVDAEDVSEIPSEDEMATLPAKRKKASKKKEGSKRKASKEKGGSKAEDCNEEGSKKKKSKKKSRRIESEIADD
ncbi:hypothetical protein Tsubulata_038435 [Turnera subulata]|uniref:WD repeat-containing protein 74 n=1 Tax=Turnera subulata TaxID=218843 RepID=A0A9Q0EZF3_9ROSI|nr:hypothetical protein Tsubulata_038435 [Turnera subulata]